MSDIIRVCIWFKFGWPQPDLDEAAVCCCQLRTFISREKLLSVNHMRHLNQRRNRKYGKAWRSALARKAVAARWRK